MTWTKARIREPFIVSKYAKQRAHTGRRSNWFRDRITVEVKVA